VQIQQDSNAAMLLPSRQALAEAQVPGMCIRFLHAFGVTSLSLHGMRR
jgi:hypothetical protein